jgi:hypothetical protein
MDDDFVNARARMSRKPPRHLGQGLWQGAQSLGVGLWKGVSGLVTVPYRGAREAGFSGFVIGVGKGLVGLVTKPASGAIDFASKTLTGLCSGTSHFFSLSAVAFLTCMCVLRCFFLCLLSFLGLRNTGTYLDTEETYIPVPQRLPRFIAPDACLKPYSAEEAEAQRIVRDAAVRRPAARLLRKAALLQAEEAKSRAEAGAVVAITAGASAASGGGGAAPAASATAESVDKAEILAASEFFLFRMSIDSGSHTLIASNQRLIVARMEAVAVNSTPSLFATIASRLMATSKAAPAGSGVLSPAATQRLIGPPFELELLLEDVSDVAVTDRGNSVILISNSAAASQGAAAAAVSEGKRMLTGNNQAMHQIQCASKPEAEAVLRRIQTFFGQGSVFCLKAMYVCCAAPFMTTCSHL